MNKSIDVLQWEEKNITHKPPSSRAFVSDMEIKHTQHPCNGPHGRLAPLQPNGRRCRRVKVAAEQARHRCHELLGRLSPKFNTTTKGTWLEIALEHLTPDNVLLRCITYSNDVTSMLLTTTIHMCSRPTEDGEKKGRRGRLSSIKHKYLLNKIDLIYTNLSRIVE